MNLIMLSTGAPTVFTTLTVKLMHTIRFVLLYIILYGIIISITNVHAYDIFYSKLLDHFECELVL